MTVTLDSIILIIIACELAFIYIKVSDGKE